MNKSFNYSRGRILLFILIAAAVSFRLVFFLFGLRHMPISTDEAWPALMGLHVLKGEFPVFYWGQNYMGSQQAFLDAFFFMLFGVNTFAARIYPLFFSFIYVAATCLLARRMYGRETAITTLALLSVPVPYLTMAGTLSVPPEYLPLTALGSCALFLLAGIALKQSNYRPQTNVARAVVIPDLIGNPEKSKSILDSHFHGNDGKEVDSRWSFPHTLLRGGNDKSIRIFLLLGLLLGFMFWLHLVAISYIVVALAFIFLRDKLCFLRPAFWLSIPAFFIGSFPFWRFNFTHDFITFADISGTGSWQSALQLLKALFGITLHFMTGQKVMLYGDSIHFVSLPPLLASALGFIWCGIIVLVILTRLRGMLRWLKWPARNATHPPATLARSDCELGSVAGGRSAGADGTVILLVLIIVILYLFCRSERSAWDNARFILPVMSALPILLACGLERVKKWNRYVFAFLLVIVIGAQAWGNFLLYQEWDDPELVGRKLELPDTTALHRFLNEHKIKYAYAHYWISYRITFESREEIICAEPFNERFPGRPAQYLDEAHAATNVAFITHPTLNFVPNFEGHLLAIGGTYRKAQAGDFTVFYDFAPPYGKIKLREIKREGWRLLSNNHPEVLDNLLDGDPNTSWATGEAQKTGHYLQIDLGRAERVCKVMFDLTGVECDAPCGYRLETSTDGKEWCTAYESGAVAEGFFWGEDHPWMYVGNNFYTAAFAPVEARLIRVTLTEGHPRFWWSIAELRVFGPE